MISCEECIFILHGRCECGNTWHVTLRTLFQRIRRSTNGLIRRSHAMQGTWDSEEILSLPTWDHCQCQQDSAREWNLLVKAHSALWQMGSKTQQIPEEEFRPYVKANVVGGQYIYLRTHRIWLVQFASHGQHGWRSTFELMENGSVVRSTHQKQVFKIGEHHRKIQECSLTCWPCRGVNHSWNMDWTQSWNL
jgi:hypothetical protein